MQKNTSTTLDKIDQSDGLAKEKLDRLKQYFINELHKFFNNDMILHNMNLKDLNRKYNALYIKRGEDTKLWDNIIARLSSCMTLDSLKKHGKEFTHYNPGDVEESTILTECIRRVLSIGLQELKEVNRESEQTKTIQIPNTPSHIENMFVGLKYTSNNDTSYDNLPSSLSLATFKI